MRLILAVAAVLLLGACSGASHPAAQPRSATKFTNCTTTTTTTTGSTNLTATQPSLPRGTLPDQESIKQAGQNGGGCYSNMNSAHPIGPDAAP